MANLEDYEILRLLGKGSFGSVYCARKKQDKSLHVIKKIAVHNQSAKERRATEQECAVLKRLRHPGIVCYEDSFVHKNRTLCIVMAFCQGGDLASVIAKRRMRYFSEPQVLQWFLQIALALQYMHEEHILHRDLKTQNIFLTTDNTIKLGDFGIAKVLEGTLEMAKTVIGTPYYMSPELFKNQPYSYKSDIWSLGCVLLELVGLRHAFEARDMKALVSKICRGSHAPVPAAASKPVRSLVHSMLALSPGSRPSVNAILALPVLRAELAAYMSRRLHHGSPSRPAPDHAMQSVLKAEGDKLQQQAKRFVLPDSAEPVSDHRHLPPPPSAPSVLPKKLDLGPGAPQPPPAPKPLQPAQARHVPRPPGQHGPQRGGFQRAVERGGREREEDAAGRVERERARREEEEGRRREREAKEKERAANALRIFREERAKRALPLHQRALNQHRPKIADLDHPDPANKENRGQKVAPRAPDAPAPRDADANAGRRGLAARNDKVQEVCPKRGFELYEELERKRAAEREAEAEAGRRRERDRLREVQRERAGREAAAAKALFAPRPDPAASEPPAPPLRPSPPVPASQLQGAAERSSAESSSSSVPRFPLLRGAPREELKPWPMSRLAVRASAEPVADEPELQERAGEDEPDEGGGGARVESVGVAMSVDGDFTRPSGVDGQPPAHRMQALDRQHLLALAARADAAASSHHQQGGVLEFASELSRVRSAISVAAGQQRPMVISAQVAAKPSLVMMRRHAAHPHTQARAAMPPPSAAGVGPVGRIAEEDSKTELDAAEIEEEEVVEEEAGSPAQRVFGGLAGGAVVCA